MHYIRLSIEVFLVILPTNYFCASLSASSWYTFCIDLVTISVCLHFFLPHSYMLFHLFWDLCPCHKSLQFCWHRMAYAFSSPRNFVWVKVWQVCNSWNKLHTTNYCLVPLQHHQIALAFPTKSITNQILKYFKNKFFILIFFASTCKVKLPYTKV